MYLIILIALILIFLFYNPMIEGFDYYFYPPVRCVDTAFDGLRCFDEIGYPDYPWNAPYWSGYRSDYFIGKKDRSGKPVHDVIRFNTE